MVALNLRLEEISQINDSDDVIVEEFDCRLNPGDL